MSCAAGPDQEDSFLVILSTDLPENLGEHKLQPHVVVGEASVNRWELRSTLQVASVMEMSARYAHTCLGAPQNPMQDLSHSFLLFSVS